MSIKLYDAEIEYLESTGTQYINSEITFVYDTDIIDISTNIAFTSNSERQLNGANGFLFWGINASGKFEVGQTAAGNYNSNFHSWKLHCQKGQKVSAKIDNTTYYGSAAVDDRQTLFYIHLCALCASSVPTGRPDFYAKQKIKRTTITKNGVLVRDLIPVRVGNVGYLFDKVSMKLIGNSGTGSFVLGPDVAPGRYANEIAFLESTGSQWINTGITNITETDTFSITAAKTSTELAMAFGWNTTLYYNLNLHHASQQKIELAWGAAGTVVRTDLNEINTFHTYSTAIENGNVNFYVDGVNKGYIEASSDDSGQTIYMFARQSNGEATLISPMKIKRFMYFRNNTLLRDFIPVEYNNIGYMYDRVSGEFFANQGTGKFVLGHRAPRFDGKACARSYTRRQLMARAPQELEYLEFPNGNVYFDSTYVPNGKDNVIQCKFKFDGYRTESGTIYWSWIFARPSGGDGFPNYRIMASGTLGYITIQNGRRGNKTAQNRVTVSKGSIYEFYIYKNQYFTVNGTQHTYTDNNPGGTNNSTLQMPDINMQLKGRFYYLKWWKGDTLVLDWVPMKQGNEIFIYDKINKVRLTRYGSGTLIAGPIK